MATLKAAVRTKRRDGMYVVYIRVTHNRQVKYIRTSWMVDDKGVSKDKQDIIDPFVTEQTSTKYDYCGLQLSMLRLESFIKKYNIRYETYHNTIIFHTLAAQFVLKRHI